MDLLFREQTQAEQVVQLPEKPVTEVKTKPWLKDEECPNAKTPPRWEVPEPSPFPSKVQRPRFIRFVAENN